jgi:hypothetical protein
MESEYSQSLEKLKVPVINYVENGGGEAESEVAYQFLVPGLKFLT